MDDSDVPPPRREFRTRWAVTAYFVVGLLLTALLLWWWSDRDDAPDEADMGAPSRASHVLTP